ncbi:hypothetical protein ACQKWADRAFT_299269 [Trichoderma austrokoningii]
MIRPEGPARRPSPDAEMPIFRGHNQTSPGRLCKAGNHRKASRGRSNGVGLKSRTE